MKFLRISLEMMCKRSFYYIAGHVKDRDRYRIRIESVLMLVSCSGFL